MVVSANHFKELTNGYEKRTDGLWVHTGNMFLRGDVAIGGGLSVAKLPVSLPDGAIFTNEIADGAVTTAKIAPNAVSQLVGSYMAAAGWSTPGPGAWYETVAQVNCTLSGLAQHIRVEVAGTAFCTVASALVYLAVGWDGAVQLTLSAFNQATASYVYPFSFQYYAAGSAFGSGLRRFALYMQTNAGTATLWSQVYTTLYVTEQKR